jgi:TolB-like protein/class 3 adenylate cyclase
MSDTTKISRRLVAVFAADVESYSRLMGADEVGTLKGLTDRRAILDRLIGEHGGRIANTAGDSVLAEFGSAVGAVQCAVEAQTALDDANSSQAPDRRICFRIGIHIGDVMVRAGDLFGDGVNIAARLQSIAQPGSVCISSATYDQVRKVLPVTFVDLGVQQVKNIQEPIRAYQVSALSEAQQATPARVTEAESLLPLPDKPSIAVLPFQNMSGDPEQEYFADGIVEDIITALSRFKGLFVVARNSSFTYKGKAVDIKRVGRELGVRYVLEGSVRKSSGKVRINGQLIDSATGSHVWADRFDGKLEDVFELQDQITASVVGELMTNVEAAEIERANRKPTANLDARDCCWRGLAQQRKSTRSSTDAALSYLLKATDLDQNFASAYGIAAVVYVIRKMNFWMVDVAQESAEAIRLARRAVELGEMDEMALCRGGYALAFIAGELDLAAECIRRGLAMNPNLAAGWFYSALVHQYLGEHETSLAHVSQSARLSPRDPWGWQGKQVSATSHMYLGHFEEAVSLAEQIVTGHPTFMPSWRALACCRALAGDTASANIAARKALELEPSLTVSAMVALVPLRRAVDVECLKEGYLRAGFPP